MIEFLTDTFWFLFGLVMWVLMIYFVIGLVVLVAMFPVPAVALMLFYWLFIRKPS